LPPDHDEASLMATPNRRTWTLGILATIIAIASTAAWLTTHQHHASRSPDCPTVRAMIDYNTTQGQQLGTAFNPDTNTQPSISDYQNWADRMSAYASSIYQPDLAAHANRLADQARQMVALVAQARSDKTVPANPQAPPPWTHAYADLAKQTHTELTALNNACPAS
ncbi:hypothetical protein ACQI5H_24400, partial [Mycobacterium heidelbergense]|uniref:hypothetical protein n=1 Tax=Mycobacterium heidelbergense TaxID=53376 RepID=UPI003CF0971A